MNINFKNSLWFTLLIWFLLLSLIPSTLITYINYKESAKNLKELAVYELKQSSLLNKNYINNWFSYRETDISSWSKGRSIVDFTKELSIMYKQSNSDLKEFISSKEYNNLTSKREAELLVLSRQYDYINDMFLIDTDGNILYTIAKKNDLGTNLNNGIYSKTNFAQSFRSTLKNISIHFSDLEYYESSNNSVVGFFTAPQVDKSGNIIGVLAVQLKMDNIFSMFNELKDSMNGFSHYLVGPDGLLRSDIVNKQRVLNFHVNSSLLLLWKEEQGLNKELRKHKKDMVLEYKNPFGNDVIGLHYDINILGVKWVLISEVSQNNILLATTEVAKKNIMFLIITFFIITLVSLIISRRITKPIKLLADASIGFSKGQRDISINLDVKGELGQLLKSFNIMIKSLSDNEQKLTTKTKEVQNTLDELDKQKFALDAHSIVAITNVKGIITFVNDKFVEISGYTREELIGQNHRLLNSGVHGSAFWKNMYKRISSGSIWHAEVCNISKNGTHYWVDTTIVPFMGKNKKPKNYIAIRTDITEQKEIEEELIKANEIAQNSLKAKSEFLASMSHEIRTPMNGIIGMLGLLLNTKLSDTQEHHALLAQVSANSLLTIINDILDFSKIEAGKLELELIDFNIRDELGNFAESIAFRAQDKGVELILDVVDIERTLINSDAGRIRQILNNLVGNSIKFTSDGYILIKAKLYTDLHEISRLKIDITDTGIGIPKDKIDSLFESFTQVDASTTRKYGGTGLGLAIVKELVYMMDGTIKVTSEIGKGSVFSIDIAVMLSDSSSLVMPKISVEGKSVIIIDKSKINSEVFKKQLELWGMSVNNILNSEGITQFNPPDIIFIDIKEKKLAKKLKKDEQYRDTKFILMTTMSSLLEAKEVYELGYDGSFPKPITTNDMFKSLDLLIKDENFYKELFKPKEDVQIQWPDNLRILLVEDNRTNQLVANGILGTFGLNADIANNGLEALEAVKETNYNIVLMDCQMPEMDGYEATAAIRRGVCGEKNSTIPIIAMTANAMQGDKEKCILAGMSEYISKPIDPISLINTLQKFIFNFESIPLKKGTIDTNKMVAWDQDDALNRLGGSKELLHKIINVFLEEIIINRDKLKDALDKENIEEIKLYAHTIKGSSANLSAMKVQEIAKLIEQDLSRDYDDLRDNIDEVVILFKEYLKSSSNNEHKITEINETDLLVCLNTLEQELLDGEFIDSDSLEIFNVSVNMVIDDKLKSLKKEVDNIAVELSIKIIKEIISELNSR